MEDGSESEQTNSDASNNNSSLINESSSFDEERERGVVLPYQFEPIASDHSGSSDHWETDSLENDSENNDEERLADLSWYVIILYFI